MYVHLGIRYIDIVLGKCLVNLSIKIIIDIPKTIYRSPCPHKNIDRTISQRMKSNEIRRFTQNTGIGLQKLDQNFLSRFIAISVTDTESPLHTTQTGTGIIDDDIVRQISIRYEYRPVITRNKDSIENLNLFHRTTLPLRLDKIAHLIRFENKNHKSARKILQRTTQCHTDSDTRRGKQCHKRSRIDTENTDDQYDQNQIVENMIGRKLTVMYPKRDAKIGEEKIRITGLDVPHPYIANRYLVKDFNLCVRKGEVVGLAGLVGAGRSEAMMAVYGELKKSAGSIWIDGAQVRIRTPGDAIRSGIGMVTEDRKKYGLLFSWSIRRNISYSDLRGISTGGFIQPKKEYKAVKQYYQSMRIKANSLNDPVESLSGGNQQKVVIGRTLNAGPEIVILDEPTKGIDVGAKAEIYELINRLAEQGVAVILISSELPELMAMSDRFVVMAEGQISGELTREEATESKIMHLATKTFKQF